MKAERIEFTLASSPGWASDDFIALLGGKPNHDPIFSVEVYSRRPGKAGLTRTQRLLAFARGPEVPAWIWQMRSGRPSWRNATGHRTFLPAVRLAP